MIHIRQDGGGGGDGGWGVGGGGAAFNAHRVLDGCKHRIQRARPFAVSYCASCAALL